jgi:hypothetical protein
LRPLDREQADVAGDVLEPNVGAALVGHDVLPGPGGIRGVDHDHELVLEPVDGAVVHESPLRGEYRGVLHAAGLERSDVVAGDPIDERVPVGPADFELSHVGDVEQAGTGSDRMMLRENPGRVLHRHLPAGKGDHLGPERLVGVI